MKKILTFFMALVLLLCLGFASFGCSSGNNGGKDDETKIEISFTSPSITLEVGDEYTVSPKIKGADSCEISVEDSSILKLEDKKITALKAGTTKVIAKIGEVKAELSVTVTEKPATDVKATALAIKGSETMKVGEEQTLTVEFTPSDTTNKSVSWLSNDPTVASVADGKVKALKDGKVTIFATAEDGSNVTAKFVITIEKDVVTGTVTLSADKTTILVGDELTINAVVEASDGSTEVTWEVDASDKASIVNGVLTAKKRGTVNVIAKLKSNPEIKGVLTITIKDRVTYISIEASKVVFDIGDEETLFCEVTPTSASEEVTWASSDENVATVSQDGRLVIVGGGNVTITATATDGSGVKGSIELRVRYLVATLVLTGDAKMYVGETQTLKIEYQPTDVIRGATYTSSDESVATVNPLGVVTGIGIGTVTITATATDAGHATTTLTIVVDKRADKVETTLCDPAVANLEKGSTYTYDNKEWKVGETVFSSLKEAIETATKTVILAPGEFTEDAVIDKDGLIIKGANAGIDPLTGTRGEESIIKCKLEPKDGISNITLDGLAFSGTGNFLAENVKLNGATFKNLYVYDTNTGVAAWSASRSYTVEAVLKFVAANTGEINNLVFENNKFSNVEETNIFFGRLKNVTVKNNGFYNFKLDAIRGEGGYNTGKWVFDGNEFINDAPNTCDNAVFLEAVSGSDGDGWQQIVVQRNVFKNIGGKHADSNYQCAVALGGFYQEKGLTTTIYANTFEACRVCINARDNGGKAESFSTTISYNKFVGIPADVYHRNLSNGNDTTSSNPILTTMDNNLFLDDQGQVITDLQTISSKLIELASCKDNYQSIADYEAALQGLQLD